MFQHHQAPALARFDQIRVPELTAVNEAEVNETTAKRNAELETTELTHLTHPSRENADLADARSDTGGVENQPVIVGRITGHYGVKGWLKVYSYTRPAEQILEYNRWMLAERRDSADWRSVRVAAARQQSKKLLAKIAEVEDYDASEALIGKWIAVAKSQLARLPAGEYYWSDLTGLSVVNQDGVELGIVDHLLETGANDVLVVRDGGDTASVDSAVERLLPWCADVIIEVNVAGGYIRVEWEPDY